MAKLSARAALLGADVAAGDKIPIRDVSVAAASQGKEITAEELAAAISALGGGGTTGAILSQEMLFVETAGAGTYTVEIDLPENAGLLGWNIDSYNTPWDADTATLDVIDSAAHAILNGEDVKEVDTAHQFFGSNIGGYGIIAPRYPSGTTLTGTLVTTGAGGTTGRLCVTFFYWTRNATTAVKS